MRLLTRDPYTYVLRDRFGLGSVAPIPSPRPCVPGPGALALTDASNVFTLSGGSIVANGTAAALSGIYATSAIARRCGRVFFMSLPVRTSGFTVGSNVRWGLTATQNASNLTYGLDAGGSDTHRIKDASTVVDSIAFGSGEHQFAIALRNTGAYLFQRTGTTGLWKLYWVYATGTGSLFPSLQVSTSAAVNFTSNKWSVIDLGGKFLTDYEYASFRDTSIVAGTTRAGLADFVLEINITLSGNPSFAMKFRRQDTNNAWIFQIVGTTGRLDEYNAGVITLRAVHNAGYPDGTYRIILTVDGQAMRFVRNNVASMNYTDTNNKFPGMTDIEYTTVGAGVTINDITLYPRYTSLPL
jgi:hypothetical protein